MEESFATPAPAGKIGDPDLGGRMHQGRPDVRQLLLSIVVPVYDEEEVVAEFEKRTVAAMEEISQPYEIIFVNDGSRDATLPLLQNLREANSNISIINLSRNFGKEIALTAGLDHAEGDLIVAIDADLQDPPELISDMLAKWSEGYDVVYAVRNKRDGETFMKKKTAEWFYLLMQRLGPVQMPRNAGDFRLMSRRFVDALKEVREHHRFMKGLYAWVGFPQTAIHYDRDARYAGRTKWNYWKLWNFSLEGITAFTTIPLRITTYLGLIVAVIAFGYGATIIIKTLLFGDPVQGLPHHYNNGPVPGRRAVDRAGRYRRVPGPNLQ